MRLSAQTGYFAVSVRPITFILLLCLSATSFALPFSITTKAGTTLPTTLYTGDSAVAYYTVTNNTREARNNNFTKYLPPNVTQVTSGGFYSDTCGSTFNLTAGNSCTLQLTVSGAVNAKDPNPAHHLFTCLSDGVTCAGTADALNVAVVSPPAIPSFTAVGYSTNDSSQQVPLTYTSTDGGQNWTLSSTLPPMWESDDYLYGAACGSNGLQCIAVGYYYNGSQTFPLTYTSTDGGERWTLSSTLPPAQGSGDYLYGAACGSNGLQCIAVGLYSNGGKNAPLTYTSTDGGKNWAVSSTLPPAQGANSNELAGVACSSDGLKCTTVGWYEHAGKNAPLTYTSTDGGQNWAVSSTLPPAQGSGGNFLEGVACSSNGLQCTAVGLYANGGGYLPLTYTSTDGGESWTLSSTLPPTQGSGDDLYSVACGSDGLQCTAVGYYSNGSRDVPLTYTSTDGGKNWAVSSTLPPAQGSGGNLLYGVTCNSNGLQCTAVGTYASDSRDVPLTYTSTDGGKNWTLSSTLPPAQGSGYNEVNGVG